MATPPNPNTQAAQAVAAPPKVMAPGGMNNPPRVSTNGIATFTPQAAAPPQQQGMMNSITTRVNSVTDAIQGKACSVSPGIFSVFGIVLIGLACLSCITIFFIFYNIQTIESTLDKIKEKMA